MNLDSPNQHCLDSLVRLSERRTVSAVDDIYDDRGFKLWAKGSPVSRDLQEKLVRRKLAKPLESSLIVEHAISFAEVVADCLQECDSQPLIGEIGGSRAARTLLTQARSMSIPPPLRLLLTSVKENSPDTYAHTIDVVTISAGIAVKMDATANDAQLLLMAALLHDIGEMYVNPEYLHATRRLAPHEWKHVVAHPRIGELLIRELTSLPSPVAQSVGQHHERHDGSGYPGQLGRHKLHRLGGWIAAADSTAALIARGGKGVGARVALALRIAPDEYDRGAVSAIIQALRNVEQEYGVDDSCDCTATATGILHQLDALRGVAAALAESKGMPFLHSTGAAVGALLASITQSMRATGVLDAAMLGDSINDPQLQAEMCLIVREVQWRMRNLGRNIYLRAEAQPDPAALKSVSELIELLDR